MRRVFVAGGTGVLGRRPVPQPVARAHRVTATTTGAGKADLPRRPGAEGVVTDPVDVVVRSRGPAPRYGGFYGRGAGEEQTGLVRRRLLPLVGRGTGHFSWVHVDDAASATVSVVEHRATGRGFCNAEAGREPRRPSWRQGFREPA